MYHNAFRQHLRWNCPRGIHGGMHADAAPDDAADAPREAVEENFGYRPPQEFWTYNREQLARPPANTAYDKYCSDWREWYDFRVPDGDEEHIPPGVEYEWYDRMTDDKTFDDAKWNLEHNGKKVRTHVELSFLFGHENPLLVIRVDKQPDWTASSFISHRTTNSVVHRHVSIGYMLKNYGRRRRRLDRKVAGTLLQVPR